MNFRALDQGGKKPAPHQDFPFEQLIHDTRIANVIGEPNKHGEVPLAILPVKGLPRIEADEGRWYKIYNPHEAYLSLTKRWLEWQLPGSLKTIITPNGITQLMSQQAHYLHDGHVQREVRTAISNDEPYLTIGKALWKKGWWSVKYEGLEGIYNQSGNLQSFLVKRFGAIVGPYDIGSIDLVKKEDGEEILVGKPKYSEKGVEAYVNQGEIKKGQVILRLVRFRDHAGNPVEVVFPRQRNREEEIEKAKLNQAMLTVRPQYISGL